MPASPIPPAQPPKRLPAGLLDLWRVVRAAAETTGRGALARRLGVSTHTLQRILVDGEIPRFPRASVRQTRSWTRTLARLAHHFDADAAVWIRAAGIPWDETSREVVRETLDRLRGTRPARFAASSGVVDVGLVATPRLVDDDFLLRCARRVVGSVAPGSEIRIQRGAARRLVEELLSHPPRISLAVGLFDSAQLRAHGLRMLPIPGWRPAFSALLVRAAGSSPAALRWEDVARGTAPPSLRYVVVDGDPADAFVRAHWGLPAERVQAHAGASAHDLAEHLGREAGSTPGRAVLFLADEGLCRVTLATLRDARDETLMAELIAPPPEEAPRFPLALALPPDGGSWSAAVTHAWEAEVFGPAKASTARLYADAMRRGSRLLAGRAKEVGLEGPSDVRPEHFREADPAFQRVLVRELLAGLLAERGLRAHTAPDAPGALETWEEVAALAHAVVPPEWRPVLDSVAWAARRDLFAGTRALERPYHPHCLSCSTSLREYPGPSTSYCRFCADEEGRLRSRKEVHELIAHWMEAWQGDLTHERALERAARYMSAMPAWSEN
ncbi:MAG: hypothetical protein U0167_17710 [bacterium]